MLAVLRIRNFAIIEEAEVEFGPGLNVLTGETGAGKSIILKAIDLLSGKRASADIVRSETPRCEIEGIFDLNTNAAAALAELHDDFAEAAAGDEVLIRRVIDASGKSKIYINDSLTTAAILQKISAPLLDITGQHSQQTLLNPSRHRALLDSFGVPEKLLKKVAELYAVFAKARNDLESLQKNSSERALYFDRLRSEYEELDAAAVVAGERKDLEQELRRLANVETLGLHVTECLEILSENEQNVDELVRQVSYELDKAAKLDSSLDDAKKLIESAAVELQEAQLLLSDYQSSLDADPTRLDAIRERIGELARLERKYGKSEEELLKYFEEISNELSEFDGSGLDEEKLKKRMEEARAALSVEEAELTKKRKAVAKKLSKAIEKDLAELNMKRARFTVDVSPCNSGPHGADEVAFALAANPGEPFRPLQKVASGGELSRILLVLKTILSQQLSPGTQIFDEIDSGIGGAVAQVVGEKLLTVANDSQVILITHAPQIAALADHQFLVSKATEGNRTHSKVVQIDRTQRVEEIAQMLAGKEVTTQFQKSAEELLQQAATASSAQKKLVNA